MPVNNKPLLGYVIDAAAKAKHVNKIFVSTDGDNIKKYCKKRGCSIIDRPKYLSGDMVNHGVVIKHAVKSIDRLCNNLDNVVVLLGNTVMINSGLIDRSLVLLAENKGIDSVMSVWEAADDHPLRALKINNGLLKVYGPNRDANTARQSYEKVYYYDQGVWTFRKECVSKSEGPNPWWWMGEKCLPIVRPWVTGRDIQSEIDVKFAEYWVENAEELDQL